MPSKTMIAVSLTALTALLPLAPAGAAPPDKACVAEVRAAGDWGRTLNPGKATFVSGTPGDDVIERIEPGVVYCGLGGHDIVLENHGWFYGGDGIDTVVLNLGTVDGGAHTDVVQDNRGEFRGRGSRDVVIVNNGFFDGGPGIDAVQDVNNGSCVDVEQGC